MSKEAKIDWKKLFAGNDRKRHTLFRRMQKYSKEIEALEKKLDFAYEDRIYRFYHYSFKVYWLQECTLEIVRLLKKINPHKDKHFCKFYTEILKDGSNKVFKISHNDKWTYHTRPITEAFLHSKYFLDMLGRTIKIKKEQTGMVTSAWAALLELYDIR